MTTARQAGLPPLSLCLLRHAKSSWNDAAQGDHERPLAPRGVKDAPRVGRWLAERGLAPQHVLCSDAVRTRATLALVLPAFSPPPDSIEFCADLYLASPEAMLTRLRQVRAARTVLMVAHNPGTHALALQLAGGGAPKTLAALAVKYPTAGLAVLTFAGAKDWAAVDTGQGLLVHFVTPRTLA